MEKIGLRIVNLIHDINQLGYEVKFCTDFENMVRIEYTHEFNSEYYHHEHRGWPDGNMNHLEKEIIKSLSTFFDDHKGEA